VEINAVVKMSFVRIAEHGLNMLNNHPALPRTLNLPVLQ